jgi:hypothetical protein
MKSMSFGTAFAVLWTTWPFRVETRLRAHKYDGGFNLLAIGHLLRDMVAFPQQFRA